MAQVEKCVCTIDSLSKKVQFELFCKRGVRKRYNICFDDEGDSLEARYNTAMPARLAIQPKTLLDCLSNFHTTALDELTLVLSRLPADAAGNGGAGPSVPVLIRSAPSMQPAADPASATLHTELTMDSASFDEYVVPAADHDDNPLSVTFSMKDFRTIVALCDSIAQPVTIQLSSAGQPMVLGTRFLNTFEATFVVATMFEPNQEAAQNQPAAAAATTTQSQKKREEGSSGSTAPAGDDTAMTDAPPAKRAQTQSPSKKQRKPRREQPKDDADESDIVLPPAPVPEPRVKEAPSQRCASGSSSSSSGPAAVVYAPRNSESEEQERLRDVGTVYCDGSGDVAAAPAPSSAPETGPTGTHTPDTASCSSSSGSTSSLPMLPPGRLFLGDSEIHLRPLFPARTQSTSFGGSRSTAEDAAQAPATGVVKHESDAMLDEDGAVQSTCPM